MLRRDFLRYLISAPIAAAPFIYGNPFRPTIGLSQDVSGKILVVIFQRGGCDGLNTIVPYADDEYYRLRPEIAILSPGRSDQTALDLDGFFGMHPALSPLHNIYQEGKVAILPAVHYDNASRSHFVSQDYIESGVPVRLPDGWLNRYLAVTPRDVNLRAVGFGSPTAHSLRGNVPVSLVTDINAFSFSNNELLTKLENVYSQRKKPKKAYHSMLMDEGKVMLDNVKKLSQIDTENYTPANGAEYPISTFGTQLRQVSQLIKEGVGLELATVESHGWDTHAKQGGATGSQALRHADFAAGIEAMYTDLSPSFMNDVLILTMTDFGRTAKQNASLGSDHGNASTWFVIGDNVKGGIYGNWPGLREEDLYLQRYLAHNIDYSNVMGEVIKHHLENAGSLSTVLPGHSYQPIGFL